MGTYDPPQNCQKLAIKYCNEEIWNGHLQNKQRNVDLKTQKVQKTINKGGIILGQVVDSLIKIKHSKDMTAGDMEIAVMPLIKICTDVLTILAHGNNLLNQTRRNYITSVLPWHMSELGKKVSEDSDWLFGDNIFSRINQIKATQQTLNSDEFKNSQNLQGFSKTLKKWQNVYYQKQPRKGQNSSNYQQRHQRKLYHQKKSRY